MLVGTDTYFLVMLVVRVSSDAKLFMLVPSMNNKTAKVFNISMLYREGKKRCSTLKLSPAEVYVTSEKFVLGLYRGQIL